MSFSVPTTIPPKGFHVTHTGDGDPAITYRTTGLPGMAIFFTVWLAIWTAVCVFVTRGALVGGGSVNFGGLLFMMPFWGAEFWVLGYALWHFWSFTVFTFGPDRLVVERSLFGYCRRREFAKQAIHAVCQVKDGGDDEDSFPTWGLAIDGQIKGTLLSRQPIDKSDWLGPVVAAWAGVTFEPSDTRR